MGLLDAILKQAGSADLGGARGSSAMGGIADLVMKNPQIIAAALAMLNPKDTSVGGGGGLADVIGAFNKGGLGDEMASWVSGGPNKPVDPGALANVLGPDVLQPVRAPGGHRTRRRQLRARLDPARARQPDDAAGAGAAGQLRSTARSARCSASSGATRNRLESAG